MSSVNLISHFLKFERYQIVSSICSQITCKWMVTKILVKTYFKHIRTCEQSWSSVSDNWIVYVTDKPPRAKQTNYCAIKIIIDTNKYAVKLNKIGKCKDHSTCAACYHATRWNLDWLGHVTLCQYTGWGLVQSEMCPSFVLRLLSRNKLKLEQTWVTWPCANTRDGGFVRSEMCPSFVLRLLSPCSLPVSTSFLYSWMLMLAKLTCAMGK